MKKSLWKDIFRNLKNNGGQFISIVLILTLGVSFFIGISITGYYMRDAGNTYFDDSQLAHVQVTTTMGVNQAVSDLLQERYPSAIIEPVVYQDVLVSQEESQLAIRLYDKDISLNKYFIITGRDVEHNQEIVLDEMLGEFFNFELGSTLTLVNADNLERQTFEVVGFARSSYYLDAFRGKTNLGNGTLEGYGFVQSDVFIQSDVFQALSILFNEIESSDSYSAVYNQALQPYLDELDEEKNEIARIRFESVVSEPKEELQKAQETLDKEIADAINELQQNQQLLDQNKQELERAITSFNEGVREIYRQMNRTPRITNNYPKTVNILRDEVTRFQFNTRETLTGGLNDVNNGLLEIEKQENELDSASEKLQASKDEMTELMTQMSQLYELRETVSSLRMTQLTVDSIFETLQTIYEGYNEPMVMNHSAFETLYQLIGDSNSELTMQVRGLEIQYNTIEFQLQSQGLTIESLPQKIDELNTLLNRSVQQLAATMNLEIEINEDAIKSYDALDQAMNIESKLSELAKNEQRLESSLEELNQVRESLEANRASLLQQETMLNQQFMQMDEGVNSLASAAGQLQAGLTEIEASQQKIDESYIELEESRIQAQSEIDENKQELFELSLPTTYILQRKDFIGGYQTLYDDSLRIERIGQVFPLFFFLIAALVSLTTIRRMVEDSSQLMGVYKAIGYTRHDIQLKYLIFSGLTLALGLLFGAWLGYTFIPTIIFDAYRILYQIPDINPHFVLGFLWLPVLLSFMSTVGIAWFNSRSILKASPAQLMRPKAPRAGKRVFLEKVNVLWKRLTFLQKVTIRNLFRNKSRFFMTMAGVAGCMGLLVTGFGLNDSIMGIPDLQFNKFQAFDVQIIYDSDVLDQNEIEKSLAGHPIEKTQAGVIVNAMVEDLDTNVIIFEDKGGLSQMYNLYSTSSNELVGLSDEGIILTEKASLLLDLDVGDSINLINLDRDIDVEVSIREIVKNYAGNTIYMSETYASEVGLTLANNALIIKMKEPTSMNISDLSESMLENEGILTIINRLDLMDTIMSSMESFYVVIVVIIIAAGALAFIVMYNLSSLNIHERERELATLKVLGFYPRETAQYVFRENIILILLGIVVGIFFGVGLHRYVIASVEIDSIMFDREIKWTSIAWSVVLTLLFSMINEFIMRRKINQIDMLSALKSVE